MNPRPPLVQLPYFCDARSSICQTSKKNLANGCRHFYSTPSSSGVLCPMWCPIQRFRRCVPPVHCLCIPSLDHHLDCGISWDKPPMNPVSNHGPQPRLACCRAALELLSPLTSFDIGRLNEILAVKQASGSCRREPESVSEAR